MATLGPVRTQVSGHAEVSAYDCQYPWLSTSSGTQRARGLLIRSLAPRVRPVRRSPYPQVRVQQASNANALVRCCLTSL